MRRDSLPSAPDPEGHAVLLSALCLPPLLLLAAPPALSDSAPPHDAPLAAGRVLEEELARAMQVFADQAPHYLALSIEERAVAEITATAGALQESRSQRAAFLDVDLRIGSPELDSTHPLRGTSVLHNERRAQVRLPLESETDYALRQAIWKELDAAYRHATERLVVVQANRSVLVAEETLAPDFEPRQAIQERLPTQPQALDRTCWEQLLRRVSDELDDSPQVHASRVRLAQTDLRKTFVDSEGTRLAHGGTWLKLALHARATAPDGDALSVDRVLSYRQPDHLPSEDQLQELAVELRQHLEALLQAPRGEPYSGPVLLHGRAAAVFFHEVLGHRAEGHRQKLDHEGKTFAEYVERPILPAFLDIYDDPTLTRYAGHDLNGHYLYDDEGVAAQRATLADDGVFKGFLMGRSPIPGFPSSNGHGRRSTGHLPISRMGNTIVEASRSVPADQLRLLLLQQVRDQGLPYGLRVEEISGGFTMTGRVMPNAFNVRAITTWKVYPDGRPDELVRGVDLVGTPLVAFSNILAAGDDPQVFNGNCGAESGWVPVSAVSPSLLLGSLELQLKEKSEDRPPLLAKPPREDGKATGGAP